LKQPLFLVEENLARRVRKGLQWPKPPDHSHLTPEERVNLSIELSSAMAEIVLDSIRDKNPGISEAKLLSLARKRIYKGRYKR
jgi:hypothetical protein